MSDSPFAIGSRWMWAEFPHLQILENHALIINHNKIEKIVRADEIPENMQREYFSEHIILPGLINAHTHVAMNFFRGLADDIELITWLNKHIWPAEQALLSHEFVYDASLLASAEMIRSGTTCFNDMYFFPEATALAAQQAGLRAHIGMTVLDILPTNWAHSTDEYIQKGMDFFRKYQHHPLIQPTWAPHSTYTVSSSTLVQIRELAEQFNLKINIHLQESAAEIAVIEGKYGKRPLRILHDLNMLNDRLIAIHMTQLIPEDIALLQKNAAHVIHCPESNMKLASGGLPTATLLKLGINVGLGTDGAASNNDLDLFSEMKTAGLLSKFITGYPQSLPAMQILQMATQNNAKALGIENRVGSLAIGKEADFIALDINQIETTPLFSPLSQIIYAAGRQHVSDVWVAGRRLMKNRQLLTLDEEEILAKAQRWSAKIRPFSS